MGAKVILVIEDDELNRKLAKDVLRIGGYQMIEACDAESGLELAREHQPDLILMDIHLPRMDGYQATKLIKSDESLKTIPVIALTALAMKGDEEKALASGCSGYITKPFYVQEFLETVARYLK